MTSGGSQPQVVPLTQVDVLKKRSKDMMEIYAEERKVETVTIK